MAPLEMELIRALELEALQCFLAEQLDLDYDLYSEYFADHLAEILQDNLPEGEADSAHTLAQECARNEADAVDKVNKILAGILLHMNKVHHDAQVRKSKELAQEYGRRESDAVTLVDELLTGAGTSMDTLLAQALARKLDYIERIDRLATIAENRRNASLREIERRRALFGEALRRNVQEIEDGEFEEVTETTPAKAENAA